MNVTLQFALGEKVYGLMRKHAIQHHWGYIVFLFILSISAFVFQYDVIARNTTLRYVQDIPYCDQLKAYCCRLNLLIAMTNSLQDK